MCGIAGLFNVNNEGITQLSKKIEVMNELIQHRGPDGDGVWMNDSHCIGLGHKRLSIIDFSTGAQPMYDEKSCCCITFNGEIYNYLELRDEIGREKFKTKSDTEVILKAYEKWGENCTSHLRGMFAFAIWDEKTKKLFCARDRFGIKPFYYCTEGEVFYFASECKALLPFIDHIDTDKEALKDYLVFQFCLEDKTLFNGIRQLLPGQQLTICNGKTSLKYYWKISYDIDYYHSPKYFNEKLEELILDSVHIHTRSDVPIGAYVSGGIDSSMIASIAKDLNKGEFLGFNGMFGEGREYNESQYAQIVADRKDFELNVTNITYQDFLNNISKIIYHMDYPVAGPGVLPQFMVSKEASKYRKVLLGGQGGDEIFGGYTRYLIAYFEQCIKAAIDGTSHNGNFVVTYESIIPNLRTLKEYKPMLKQFWSDGLFEELDERYFKLVNRAPLIGDEVNWEELEGYSAHQTFLDIFHSDNVKNESYFDLMTHFDFKTLLPALLQVEDRVSMANGIESRVPLLDHKIVEFASTIPADVKFKNGDMKHCLKTAMGKYLPEEILNRKDKMGFPVPLNKWMESELKDFIMDTFSTTKAQNRSFIDNKKVLNKLNSETKFGRTIWGYLCIELWNNEFHDKQNLYKNLLKS